MYEIIKFNGMITCPECDGKGFIMISDPYSNSDSTSIPHIKMICERCNGTGWIADEDYINEFQRSAV